MGDYVNIEDNEDGTMTIRTNITGEDFSYVVPGNFETLLSAFSGSTEVQEVAVTVAKEAIVIPNDIEQDQ